MEVLVILAMAFLPGYILGKKIYNMDSDKEPKEVLKKIIIWGAIFCIPAALIEVFIDDLFTTDKSLFSFLWANTIGVALIEEIAKFIPVYRIGTKSKFFDDIYDAIVYGAFAALGFATFENLFYVFGEGGGLGTAIMRLIFSVPGHIAYGIIMGYFLGVSYNAKSKNQKSKARNNMILAIGIPTIFHGIYDGVIEFGVERSNVVAMLLALGLNLYITIYAFKKAKKISEANEKVEAESLMNNFTKKLLKTIGVALIACILVCNASFLNWDDEEADPNVNSEETTQVDSPNPDVAEPVLEN